MNKIMLNDVKNGSTFKIGDVEFIKFFDEGNMTVAVTRETVFDSTFGDDNNLAESNVIEKLKEEFLPKIAELVREEDILEFETDLTTLDGLKPYEPLMSKISLPTFDFYRENVNIFDKHKLNEWWWLATPESANPHSEPWWTTCVSPSGRVNINVFISGIGVRPILNFVSDIFGSLEE